LQQNFQLESSIFGHTYLVYFINLETAMSLNQESSQEYLEEKVFPILLPALEELLRWVQTNKVDKSVRNFVESPLTFVRFPLWNG
jgi:hypothetical protein